MKTFYWLSRSLTKLIFQLAYGHKAYGVNHIPPGRAIIAPNHASFLDPPLIAASWPEEISFLARKSLFSSTILNFIITRLNAYPVTGTAQDLGSIKLICQLLNEDKKVVIFPEGIRTFDGTFGDIKSGIVMLAQRCHAPIIPVYIHGSYDVWDRSRKFPKITGKTACVIGSPIYCEEYKQLDKKRAQEAIATKVKESLLSLQSWYENGANGAPP